MAFLPNDLYLASSTGQVINNWVDPVYKFDSSSFYNWEQDNLPVYDLEDRDNQLHESAGYPGTVASGIMLTVSDCGIDNKKVFATLSAALEVLPNTIRAPVIIEVCTSGQIGDLRLENKEFSPSGGGIEIINRGFAKVLCGSSTDPSASVSAFDGVALTDGSAITLFSSVDTSNTMADTFSVGLSGVPIGSKSAADRFLFWSVFNRAFVLPPEWARADTVTDSKTCGLSSRFADTGDTLLGTTLDDGFSVNIYQDNSVSSDIIVRNFADTTPTNAQRPSITWIANQTRTTGFIYANALSNVTVKNCSGKVYIRGFCVDGGSQADITTAGTQRTNIGFDIQDSEVVIENCTATRCKDAGIQAVNSNVTLNRGFVAYHNYELTSENSINLNVKVTTNPTPGLRAINSNLTLSSALEDTKGCPLDSPFCFSRNMVGIDLQNSQVRTPPKYRNGLNVIGDSTTDSLGSETIVLQSFLNVNEGIKAKQSLIELGGRLASFQNNVGVKLENSTCKVAEVTIDHNQEGGLVADGSLFNYNKDAQLISRTAGLPFYPVTNFKNNGQHAILKESEFIPTYVSGMDTVYNRLSFSGNHQIDNYATNKTTLPAVVIDDSSYMNAVCPNALGLVSIVDSNIQAMNSAVKGSAFQVTNNSTLDLNGTGSFNTYIVGPLASSKQQHAAALYAGNNSNINIAGPTTIVQYGIDALAEDNSTIQIGPHQKNEKIDVSGWSLHNVLNHSRVQLHATRACLVANRGSTLNMHDLGDYHKWWENKYYAAGGGTGPNVDYPTGDADEDPAQAYYTSGFFSHGSLQFYPNPFVPYGTGTGEANLESQAGWPTAVKGIDGDSTTFVELPRDDDGGGYDTSNLSWGGMCVRAVGESRVEAKNIWFPTGWANTSGPFYDLSGAGDWTKCCDHLRIWNIADNSELHASYFSVSEAHPQDMSGMYYGPSAMWTSSLATLGLSGAPSSTPDTSSASILDSFGLGIQTGGDLGYYGKTAAENIGPFRIYVSPSPKAKFLGYVKNSDGDFYIPPANPDDFISMGFTFPSDATLVPGAPYQLISQGYATSSDCSATNNQGATWTNASAIYQDLGFSGYITTLPADQQGQNVASSFFYTSAMLPYDSESRIWLDDSAMSTFANAKNGTLGTSGRKKIFSYYRAITDYPGEGFAAPDSGETMQGEGIGSVNLFDIEREL